jgi:hypothetical protein
MPKPVQRKPLAASAATPALFEDLEPAEAPGSSGLRFLGREQELSKEQKTFNRLMTRIRNLQARIEVGEKKHFELDQYFAGQYRPALEKLGRTAMQLALQIENAAAKPGKNVKRLLKRIIPALLEEAFSVVEPDPEALVLHDKYAKQSYQALQQEAQTEEGQAFLDLMEAMGLDLPPEVREKINEAEGIDAITEHLQRELESAESAVPAPRPRKKTQRQIERTKREQQKQELKQRSLRDIYIALAKVLHPDIESDPERRLHKEAFLKRATVAYNEGNLVELLHLEMEWLESSGLQESGPDRLVLYIELLKDQIKGLEVECDRAENRFWDTYGVFALSIESFQRDLKEEKRKAEFETGRLQRMAQALEADPGRVEGCLQELLQAGG